MKLTFFLIASLALTGCAQEQPPTASNPTPPPVVKAISPETEAACLAKGGWWGEFTYDPELKKCWLDTTDGGKPCKTSAECQSECEEDRGIENRCSSSVSACWLPTGRDTVTQCVF